MLRFLLVGVVNTLVGAGIMFLLYNLAGCSYWLSSAANYIVGGVVSYFLNKYYTFKNTERSWKQVLRFAPNDILTYFKENIYETNLCYMGCMPLLGDTECRPLRPV